MNNTCFFTIVSKNYTHVARTLMHSIEEHYPNADRVVALCDKSDGFDYSEDNFSIFALDELDNIPLFSKFLFRYTILELNTAIKPYVIEKLFDRGYDKVFYIDPDIKIYSDLTAMVNLLDQHEILLTPHLTGQLDDDKSPNELDILRSGTYNLGYVGLLQSDKTRSLVKWWQSKLYTECVVDLERGLFVDQKWMDMVPGLFGDVYIQRHEGWNVAYWNLAHRDVQKTDDGYKVNGQGLVFFHFSGFNPDLKTLSKHQNRFTRDSAGPAVARLCADYASDLDRFGAAECRNLDYAFGSFSDGTPIPDQARYIYRDEMDWEADENDLWSEEGAANFMGYLNEPVEINGQPTEYITRLAYRLYRQRQDLRDAFPDLLGIDGINYAQWYVDNATDQAGFAECFVLPMRNWLAIKTTSKKKRLSEVFYKSLYRLARKSRSLVRPFLSSQLRHRVNLALIRRSNANVGLMQSLRRTDDFGINLYGYVHAESGVGQSARANIASLSAVDIPVSVIDVRLGNVSRMQGQLDETLKGEPKYRINLFHINADQFEIALGNLGLDVLERCFNIGFWAWELPEFPSDWAKAGRYLDEIWTPSEFCRKAIAAQVDIPVRVVPHAVWLENSEDAELLGFDVDFKPYTFCTMFDCLSVPERKNVRATIEAFEAAFGEDPAGTQLLIKVVNLDTKNDFAAFLNAKASSNKGIKLLPMYLDRGQVYELLQQSDCFVSLHRSEGFGLGIAEAMLLGKPVIVTNWSGNADFCNEDNSFPVEYELIKLEADHGPYKKGQTWAEPSIKHAAELMVKVTNSREQANMFGQRAAKDIEGMLAPHRIGKMLGERLSEVHAQIVEG